MIHPTARYSHGRIILASFVILTALTAWAVQHAYHLLRPAVSSSGLTYIWLLSFVILAWSTTLAALERPKTATARQRRKLDRLKVVVLIPAYNEDPALLKECIGSLLNQSRQPQHIFVVDDGSTKADYTEVKAWTKHIIAPVIKTSWIRTTNQGKRHAQAYGITATPDADVYLTVDSDTILDRYALEQVLLPFTDPLVQSVAGILLPLNGDANFLTRFSGVWEVVWQLIDRSAQSFMNCVTVNSGPIAVYRAKTIRQYLDGYLNEEFFGRRVNFSDDSLLTTYSLMHGKTVQQPTAIAFSSTPESVNHHLRRYVRWMRGSFIRSWWRFKYLPLNSYVFWLHWLKWCQIIVSSVTFIYLLLAGSLTDKGVLPYLLIIPVLVSYAQALRYLAIRRTDQSFASQFCNYLLAPVATLWLITVLRGVRWYAWLTCLKTGWGTRQKVEVTLERGSNV